MASGPIFLQPVEVLFRHNRLFVLRNQHINGSLRQIHRDLDWSEDNYVPMTIHPDYDRLRRLLLF